VKGSFIDGRGEQGSFKRKHKEKKRQSVFGGRGRKKKWFPFSPRALLDRQGGMKEKKGKP